MKVLYIVMDQMEESEAIVPIDLLRRAGLEVVSCSLQDKTVTTSHNIKVEADILLDEADESYDCIVLPGGAGHRAYFENEEINRNSDIILKEIKDYANIYLKMLRVDFEYFDIKKKFMLINDMNGQIAYPYLMDVLTD